MCIVLCVSLCMRRCVAADWSSVLLARKATRALERIQSADVYFPVLTPVFVFVCFCLVCLWKNTWISQVRFLCLCTLLFLCLFCFETFSFLHVFCAWLFVFLLKSLLQWFLNLFKVVFWYHTCVSTLFCSVLGSVCWCHNCSHLSAAVFLCLFYIYFSLCILWFLIVFCFKSLLMCLLVSHLFPRAFCVFVLYFFFVISITLSYCWVFFWLFAGLTPVSTCQLPFTTPISFLSANSGFFRLFLVSIVFATVANCICQCSTFLLFAANWHLSAVPELSTGICYTCSFCQDLFYTHLFPPKDDRLPSPKWSLPFLFRCLGFLIKTFRVSGPPMFCPFSFSHLKFRSCSFSIMNCICHFMPCSKYGNSVTLRQMLCVQHLLLSQMHRQMFSKTTLLFSFLWRPCSSMWMDAYGPQSSFLQKV